MTTETKPKPTADDYVRIQPCKPRLASTATDRLPMVYREGGLDALELPSIIGGQRVYKDGRKEPL